ncbi:MULTISPECIES: hypothetical protein [Roseobacteraceae]|uniref:Uncharacterized protein n=1 Tax=Pseudosulfitobacter pseudonitzschiae TaxID=1402135 RepID=A0A221K5X1_9RHOB|nr:MULTISPECIES: hypothetical protein [Roseobacteraceae]ASM74389.1 hypothetical protein SULPSESMR1_04691 [Pseudosulfitobacter pseudonitzschiae]
MRADGARQQHDKAVQTHLARRVLAAGQAVDADLTDVVIVV